MLQIGKTIAMLLSNSNASNKTEMFKKLLSGAAAIAVIALTIAMLVSALILSALIYAYNLLLMADINQHFASAIIGVIILAIIAMLIKCMMNKINIIKDFPAQLAQQESPIAFQASGVARSFFDGLLR